MSATEEAITFTESDVLLTLRRSRWLSLSIGGRKVVQMNWVVSLIASSLLWGFIIWSSIDGDSMYTTFYVTGRTWVTQNFSWFYVGTQDVWALVLLWVTVSRYGHLKLGPDEEKPRFSDGAWFSMLFTTGLGIGFFFYGVSEPLYYYRQPRSWSGSAPGSDIHKPGYDDDDQKANQAIFITLYHWGLHGWIPYLVPTVLLGLVSHRWGLPMTVRSTFYPLIGNHIFSTLGDIIDALSIACTTFGVCTSLVLGAGQVVAFCNRIYLGPRRFASDAGLEAGSGQSGGGKWPPSFCPFPEGGDEEAGIAPTDCGLQTFQQLVIWSITAVATASVILGLDAGLKAISFIAMSLAMLCFMLPFVSDNTWFMLNTFVQQVGYYFQNLIQVGFDCEAFQQLGVELRLGSNHLWGQSKGAFNLMDRLKDSGVNNGSYVSTTGPDCGAEKNPCFVGSIAPAIAAMSSAYLTSAGLSAADAMKAFALSTAYPNATAIPCGSSFTYNETHVDAATAALGLPLGEPLPGSLQGYAFPDCPTTTYAGLASWGACSQFEHVCHAQTAYFQSSDTNFMNSWTIFYWGWWISWAPFFGIFVGQISRGRTIREVVLGAFVVPFFICCLWFSTFGGLGIKMERVAEIALQVKPDWMHGSVDCSDHYDGDGAPLSAGAKALSTIGYTMLSCMPWDNQILDVVEPYMWAGFWHILGLITLLLWYITSSDSGSYADELLASSGLSHPPALQKVYWCCTEGALASVILSTGGNARRAIQGVAIVAGLPQTCALCVMCVALVRVVKFEGGDEALLRSMKFNTQLFDFVEGYRPQAGSPFAAADHLRAHVLGLVCPFFGIYDAARVCDPAGLSSALKTALICTTSYYLLWIFQLAEAGSTGIFVFGWFFFFLFVLCLTGLRMSMRQKYNIWGSAYEDFVICLTMWPWAVGQMQLQARNNGEGARAYCADIQELKSAYADKRARDRDAKGTRLFDDSSSAGVLELVDKTGGASLRAGGGSSLGSVSGVPDL